MEQYFRVKGQHPKTILLFRVGDFYETFGEDAVQVSRILGIVLTARNNGGSDIELAGFPYHSLDVYLPKLVRGGYRVAICEQLEKPSKEKKIVKRGVTEIVTPGVIVDDQLLNHRENNFLAAIHYDPKTMGVAFLDLSTGEFLIGEGDMSMIDKLLQTYRPSEVLFAKGHKSAFEKSFGDQFYTFPLDEWIFTDDYAQEKLLGHFQSASLKGFGVEEMQAAQVAAGGILHYLGVTENKSSPHVGSIQRILPEDYVWMDKFTIRNLELVYSNHPTGVPLIEILDRTVSPMGARLLRKWILLPLKSKLRIEDRQAAVQHLLDHNDFTDLIERSLQKAGDPERLISKISMGKGQPRDLRQLAKTLSLLPDIKEAAGSSDCPYLVRLSDTIQPCPTLLKEITETIVEDPPSLIQKGSVIQDGCSEELDSYRHIIRNSKQILIEIQTKEAEATGITNLKVGFNNVFGYYLEVTNKYKNQGLVPDHWVRKQTLTGSERYITDELKVLETKILEAEEKTLELELAIFERLTAIAAEYIEPIQHSALQLAKADCVLAFARVAAKNEYCKPEIADTSAIQITAGRHPVIEHQLEPGQHYIPNDLLLNNDDQQILMITGPNMSGKSAILRQTALICIMAQMGSFVPAKAARLGVVDKVFTRVGASDNISSGESTFMVEMNETASIMNNITERSLVLLDEIGRGTSTYDGISIAWSIAEYLHHSPARAKTLFATHYHELNELATTHPRIHNFHVSTREVGQDVIFLRKLTAGGSQHSFGIHVARMAGMPASIVKRAGQLLAQLEQKSVIPQDAQGGSILSTSLPDHADFQLNIFDHEDLAAKRIREILDGLDTNTMTPIECMLKINELKQVLLDKSVGLTP